MSDLDTPVTIGGHFVLVTPDDVSSGHVQLHVSIAVGSEEELSAADLSVSVRGGDVALDATEGPEAGPLPTVESGGMTAFAQYTFSNPDDATPVIATVSIGGESAEFDLSQPPPNV
jgi:hypothetical protein